MTDTSYSEDFENEGEQHKVMTLFEHLDELRVRLVKSLGAILLAFFITIAFGEYVIELLKLPLSKALPEGQNALHFIGPMDVFVVYIKVGFLGGILMGSPVWLYQFWRFLEPALYSHEKKYILPFSIASIILFISGVVFCYSVILPFALEYLVNLGGDQVKAMIGISQYFSMLILMILGFGIVFEAPLILVLLSMLDLVSSKALTANRKIVLIGILVAGAVFTPPDPISQIGLAGPMYLMFEISILIIKVIEKKRNSEST